MKGLKFWSKDFGDKKLERIYVNSDKLGWGDKLYIERHQNIIDGLTYGDDWKPVLKTDSMVTFSCLGYNDKLSAAYWVIEDFKLNGKTFDEIKEMCK